MKYITVLSSKKKVTFRVEPKGLRLKDYYDLNYIIKDFTSKQLKNAVITIAINSVVVGHLNTKKVIDELTKP